MAAGVLHRLELVIQLPAIRPDTPQSMHSACQCQTRGKKFSKSLKIDHLGKIEDCLASPSRSRLVIFATLGMKKLQTDSRTKQHLNEYCNASDCGRASGYAGNSSKEGCSGSVWRPCRTMARSNPRCFSNSRSSACICTRYVCSPS